MSIIQIDNKVVEIQIIIEREVDNKLEGEDSIRVKKYNGADSDDGG